MSEIARNISATEPISDYAQLVLQVENVDSAVVADTIDTHRNSLEKRLAELECALALSTPEVPGSERPAPAEMPTDVPKRVWASFKAKYQQIIAEDGPAGKMREDSRLVEGFLNMLGPSNSLRTERGLDATFELENLRQLLQTDFYRLPVEDQLPEKRYAEALIAAEMAMLWHADTPKETVPATKGFVYVDDPNVSHDGHPGELSDDQKWALAGAQLAAEAAVYFRATAESPTASPLQRLEAEVRLMDMEARRLTILAGAEPDERRRGELYVQLEKLGSDGLFHARHSWLQYHDKRAETGISPGNLYEIIVLAQRRYELAALRERPPLMARFAFPREDSASVEAPRNANGDKVSLSADAIVYDARGTTRRIIQVKGVSDEGTTLHEAQLAAGTRSGATIYPEDYTDMVRVRRDASGHPEVLV